MLESKHLRTLEEKFLGHNDNGVFFSFVAFLAYYREPWIFGKSFFDTLPSSSIFINILSCHDKVLFFSFFCALYTLWLYFCVSSQESM